MSPRRITQWERMMAKRLGVYDRAARDFLAYAHMHKVEREKDRPWLSEAALVFLAKKGVVKEEGGKQVISVGEGWVVLGRVGTRAGRYLAPQVDDGAKVDAASTGSRAG
jgi:hypothetical protein